MSKINSTAGLPRFDAYSRIYATNLASQTMERYKGQKVAHLPETVRKLNKFSTSTRDFTLYASKRAVYAQATKSGAVYKVARVMTESGQAEAVPLHGSRESRKDVFVRSKRGGVSGGSFYGS